MRTQGTVYSNHSSFLMGKEGRWGTPAVLDMGLDYEKSELSLLHLLLAFWHPWVQSWAVGRKSRGLAPEPGVEWHLVGG